ncbi:MAG TPA: PKD domain-containing protein [Planctomycetota bacterium]|nr:PKD domain-containing protein [Planctomycetota bacterium]
MRRAVVVCLCLAVGLLAGVAAAGQGNGAGAKGRILYQLKKGAGAAQLAALDQRVRARGLAHVRALRGLDVHVAHFLLGRATERAVCAELMATGAVAFAEPDRLVPPVALPNDPYYSRQWQHATINCPGAWDTTTGSTSVLVAVCDTGVRSSHPDLAANLQLPGYNTVDGSTNTEPVYNHGTGVAGCIGAVGNNATGVAGVAWRVKILPIRITNTSDGMAYVSDAAEAIRYAADQGAKVVNLSYLMASYATIDSAAQYLRGKGGLLFVAAGNDAQDPGWPDFASFVAVGATDNTDAKAGFSNFGAYIDVVAPGVSVYSTSGSSSYAYMSGTSFASPIAAGLAALIYAVNPSYAADEVESIIFSTCKDLGAAGDDDVFGHGRIDAAAAIARAANLPPNTPPLAVAAASPTRGPAPLAVAFDGSSSTDGDGVVVSYGWSFGDGASATGAAVAHTYAAQGAYTATLTVTDDRGATDADAVQIVVEPDPSRVLHVKSIDMALQTVRGGTIALATVCIVNALDAPVSGVTVTGRWTGPRTSTVAGTTGANGTVTLASAKAKGTFTYTFTVTGVSARGYTYDPSLNVETSDSISSGTPINQPPKAAAAASPTMGLAPLTVAFDGSASSDADGQIVSYQWAFGDGTTGSGATVQHTYLSGGTYTAVLTVTDNRGAKAAAQVAILVYDDLSQVVFVHAIDLRLISTRSGMVVEARVRVVNGAGQPAAGVAVSGAWSGIVSGRASATTDATGTAIFASRATKKRGTATFTVTALARAGYLYDPGSNLETRDSIAW